MEGSNPTPSVLVVEDQVQLREMVVGGLRDLCDIEAAGVAADQKSALQWLVAQPDWTLLVVDLHLASGSGLAVIRAVQQRKPGQHVVVLAALPSNDVRRRCIDAGADAVFDKTSDFNEFFDHCARLGASRRR